MILSRRLLPPGRYDVAYQLVAPHAGGTDSALTVGVQQNTTGLTGIGCDPTGTNPPAGVASGTLLSSTHCFRGVGPLPRLQARPPAIRRGKMNQR